MDAKFRACPILDTLDASREINWRTTLDRPLLSQPAVVDLTNFSFLDDPATALISMKKISRVEATDRSARLNFKDNHCQDAGAYLILAEIWPMLAPVFQGGEMSLPVQRVLKATGVSDHNNMATPGTSESKTGGGATQGVWAYPLQRRRPANSSKSETQHLDSQAREKAADRFSRWMNECLGESADLELTSAGKAQLAGIIGEALCNAERHSIPHSDDGGWSITAFMERLTQEANTDAYRCRIAFLSVGQSFDDSLSTAAPDVRSKLEEYLATHRNCGRSQSTLATVFALQDTITCDPDARSESSGGTGLQDILDFVSMIGPTAAPEDGPKVTIISGGSCIRLRHPYVQGIREGGDPVKPRLLWFNAANSMEDPPQPEYVFDLPDRLAGTLVTIAFTIDQAFLAKQLEREVNGVD